MFTEEVLKNVFPLLEGEDLAACMGVCKQWRHIAKDDFYWKCQCAKKWPSVCKRTKPPTGTYYKMFQTFSKRRLNRTLPPPRLSFENLEFFVDIWSEDKPVYSGLIPGLAMETGIKPLPSGISNVLSLIMPLFFSLRFLFFSAIIALLASIVLYRFDTFDPAPLPSDALVYSTDSIPPLINNQFLTGAEFIGAGLLNSPEDIAYHRDSGFIYTGCVDGWVKRVKAFESANDSVVEDWVNTGGRPLGLAFGLHGEVIVADAYKGLLNISDDGKKTELLTDEAEGVKFKLTDAVAVRDNGVLYFTDASYKYNLHHFAFDIWEGKPHGRLMSFDPITRTTRVLLRDRYFSNGVSMSPDQTHLVFCETPLRRCSKYYINEERVEVFIQSLPGYPDNIRCDGDGHYWIAMPSGVTTLWKLSFRYPFIRKLQALAAKYGFNTMIMENAGVLQVDLDGKPIALYHDPKHSHVTSGVKIGKYLYCGSLLDSHIVRLDLLKYPAQKRL